MPTLPDDLLDEVFLHLSSDKPACLMRASLAGTLPWRYRDFHDFHGAPRMLGFLPYDAPFLNGIDKKTKARIRVGVAAFLWEIWNCRNDVVFNKQNNVHFLQVVHKALYSIQMWSFLLSADQRGLMDTGCARM